MAERPVHPSMQRLLDGAREATSTSRAPIRTWADVLKRLDVTDQTFNNWKRRGLSRDGAIQAAALFGLDSHWLRTGETTSASRRATVHELREPSPLFMSDAELLSRLSELLSRVPEGMRNPIADVLAGWARDGGNQAQDRIRAVLALLATSSKQKGAA